MNDRQPNNTSNRESTRESNTTSNRESTRESNTAANRDPARETAANRDPARESNTGRETANTDAVKWVSALVAIAGLWIIASPFVYEATDTAVWNNTLVGTGIFLLAGYNFIRLSRDRLANVGVAALALLLGLWIAVSPFVMVMGSDALANSTMVSGLVVVLLAAYSVYANRKADAPESMRTRA